MDFLKIPDQQLPLSNGLTTRARSNSCQNITLNDRRGSWLPDITRWRSASVIQMEPVIHHSVNNELLYKITDVVLIICATIFIVCTFAYGVLWIYGLANSKTWDYKLEIYDINSEKIQ